METELSSLTSHGVIAIPEDDHHEWIASVEQKMTKMPRLLRRTAGRSSCCIFRVPRSLVEINRKAYEPHIVSIGPYHHGKDHLMMIQEHKWRFLGDALARLGRRGISIRDLFKAVAPLEGAIRESYSECIRHTSKELVEMMVLDGCFVIELFRIVGGYVRAEIDDPIFNMSWLFYFLQRDLLRLENQIPFFVLQALYQLTIHDPSTKTSPSLTELALGFFDYAMRRPQEVLHKHKSLTAKHLLDLFRLTLVPSTDETPRKDSRFLHLIQSANNLHLAGIRIKPRQADTILDVKFNNGTLEIPPLTVDDSTTSLLLNCIAFEQSYNHCPKHITSYLTLMSCLISSAQDAGRLCDRKVIENYIGNDDEVANFFGNLGKDVPFDINRSYLAELFEDVNEYCRDNWHVRWASFKHTHFNTPWSIISALAAAILLVLATIQSFFAVYSYVPPAKEP